MKMWICRSEIGYLFLFSSQPSYDECGMEWFKEYHLTDDIIVDFGYRIDSKLYPEVTFENSPMEVELKVKHSGMRLSPMFRLLDMIVIKDPSDRKRIVAYTKKLIDKLKEEGFDADTRVAEEYLKMFNGESIAMATMDGSGT